MSNTDLTAAKDLIQEKRYAEARALLKTVDHPTAVKWLAKLDEISPETVDGTVVPSPTRVKGKVPWLSAISMIAIVFLTVMMIYQQIRINNLIKYVGGLETDISTVRTNSATTQTTDSLSTRIKNLETDNSRLAKLVSAQGTDLDNLDINLSDLIRVVNSNASDFNSLVGVVNSHATDITNLSRSLSEVASVAHSHGYSDLRLKTDIVQINNPLERILSLRGVSFTWNTQAYPDLHLEDGRDYGVLAQEVKAVFPELVTLDSESGMYRVDYQGLIPILIESIRQQQEQINGLRLEISQTE